MNDYWHIPRASLSPSSASSAVSSASSTQRSHRSKPTPTHYRRQQQPQYNQQLPPTSSSSASPRHHQTHLYGGRAAGGSRRDSEMSSPHHTTNPSAVMANNKRGSRSSQGSNDSNNSTRSAASGSLLLTAANLERMTEIHRKQHKHQNHQRQQQQQQHNTHLPIVSASANVAPSSIYSANLIHATSRNGHDYQLATVSRDYDYRTSAKASLPSKDHVDNAAAVVGSAGGPNSVIDIDPNLNFIKTKDLDTVSIASSMHFTMVNGEAGANKKTKKGLCDRGRQVTVLIISMSTIFLLLIMGMVYALEMRAREMPQS